MLKTARPYSNSTQIKSNNNLNYTLYNQIDLFNKKRYKRSDSDSDSQGGPSKKPRLELSSGEYSASVNSILPPFSGELTEDSVLNLKRKDFGRSIKALVKNTGLSAVEKLCHIPNYPEPGLLAKFASAAYTDYEKNENIGDYEKRLALPEGWKLLTTATNTGTLNGYFSSAFWHPEYHQVVIAHRGTKPTTLGSDWADVRGVVSNNYVPQMNSAVTFSEKVSSTLNQLSQELGIEFQLFFTGHSLGGWLAQITTFTTKYLKKEGDNFLKEDIDKVDSYHAHTVVFDSPGCEAMLSQMRDRFDVRYRGSSIDVATLDITSYLSAPNRINTCNTHVGTVYRLLTDLSGLSQLERSTGLYNLAAHSMDKTLQTFDASTGQIRRDAAGHIRLQEVIDWPISGSIKRGEEYKRFFQWANHLNDYHPDSTDENFQLQTKSGYYPIRYQTKPVDEKSCSLSVFTATERQFLERYRWLQQLPEFFKPQTLFDASDTTSEERLKDFEIIEDRIHCQSVDDLQKIIPYVKQLLKLYPKIPDGVERQLTAEGMVKRVYELETENYLKEIQKTPLDFKESDHNLMEFLNTDKQQIWHQEVDGDTKIDLIRTYKSFEKIKQSAGYSQCTVLKLKRLLAIHQMIGMRKLFDSPHLLMIECKALEKVGEIQALFDSLATATKDNPKAKLILIGNKNTQEQFKTYMADVQLPSHLYYQTENQPWTWKDLTADSQRTLLKKNLRLQGKSITLSQLLFNQDSPYDLSEQQLDSLCDLDAATIKQLSQATKEGLRLDHELLRLSDLETAYSKRLEKIDSINLLRVLRGSEVSGTLFVFSGLDSIETFLQRLGVIDPNETQELTKKIGQPTEEGKNIILVDHYGETQFKQFCHDNLNRPVQWLSAEAEGWLWQQFYDPNFYLSRSLRKVVVNPTIKQKLLSDSPEQFIFSGLPSEEALLQLLDIKEESEKEKIKLKAIIKQSDIDGESEFNRLAAELNEPIYWLKADGKLTEKRLLLGQPQVAVSTDNKDAEFSPLNNERLVIIVDEPGMGKSTTLTRITEQRLDMAWIVRLNFKDCQLGLDQLSEHPPSLRQITDFLWKTSQGEAGLTNEIFYSHLKIKDTRRPLLILLDGFDEIGQLEQQKVEALLKVLRDNLKDSKHQVIVTTRRHPQLEQHLKCLYTVQFDGLKPKEQSQFLQDFWRKRSELLLSAETEPQFATKSDSYIKALLAKANAILGEQTAHFISIPLQIRLLAESFQDAFIQFLTSTAKTPPTFADIQVATLYQRFVDTKYQLYFKEKSKPAAVSTSTQEGWIRDKLTKYHRRLAFQTLFPKTASTPQEIQIFGEDKLPDDEERIELYRMGLVQKAHGGNQFEFIHRTFAEYFVADLLFAQLKKGIKNLKYSSVQQFVLEHILLEPQHRGIRLFLGNYLENNPLEEDQLKKFGQCIDELWSSEKLKNPDGTTLLHIASQENNLQIIRWLFKALADKPETIKTLANAEQKDQWTPLHLAALNGHKDVAELLIGRGAMVGAEQKDKGTPLHLAAGHGHKDVAELLIGRGAMVNAEQKDKGTPLHRIALNGHKDVAELLIERGAMVDAKDENEWTPLHLIALNGYKDVAELLIEGGANVNAETASKWTPLHFSALNGHKDVAELLIDKGANINAETTSKWTPLHETAKNGNKDIAELLIEKGATVNTKMDDKRTPLHEAADNGHKDVAELLIDKDANVDAETDDKRTPLHEAAQNGHKNVVQLLIERGANVNAETDDKRTPLHEAAQNGHKDVVQLLIDKSANINAETASTWTPLYEAADNGHKDVVQLLIERGANVNAETASTWIPLHTTALNGHKDIVQLLIDKGANVNAETNNKWTPLHLVAQNGYKDVAELLIERGANVNAERNNKWTPLHEAAQNGHKEVAELLIERGANVNAERNNKWTPLHEAAQNGHKEVAELLIEKGANVNAERNNKATPLHEAAQNGHKYVVELLIEKGANVNAEDEGKWTSLHEASLSGHKDVAELLIEKGANVNAEDKGKWTPLRWVVNNKHSKNWDLAVMLLNHGARINDLDAKHCQLLEDYINDKENIENKEELLEKIERRLSELPADPVMEVAERSEQVLEPMDVDEVGPSRCRRDLQGCEASERDVRVFSYELLDELLVSEGMWQASRLQGQLALSLAWRQHELVDKWMRYQRYLGEIVEEGAENQSPREQKVLLDHYQHAVQFFEDNPQMGLLERKTDDFSPAKGELVFLQNGQHSWLVFNSGERYQLYSADFNYRQCFQTRAGVSWSELSGFMRAFFTWKSGSGEYHPLVLSTPLPEKAVVQLQEAAFWQPEAVAPDSVLLERAGLLEGVPLSAIRELIRLKGQVVDEQALHADIFQQAGVQLNVDNLHQVLPTLTEAQRQALVQLVQRYHWPLDNSLLARVSAEEQALLTEYQQQVLQAFQAGKRLTPEQLSALSWKTLGQAIEQQPGLPAELKTGVIDQLQALHTGASRHAWVKGMATQTLFFLPDMIRAANTGQVDGLVRLSGMLVTDGGVNHIYGKLLERLAPTLSETRLAILQKLPVTSPVFKALTVYSVVELTQQLQQLSANSEQRQLIQHRLGEQYATLGLMVVELLGFETGPLWIGLMAEQLIFDAIAFRKEHHLDIPFWEAFIMSLGFEQAKLQDIVEERQLVDINLAQVERLNAHANPPYGWVLVKVPPLGLPVWQEIASSQMPNELQQQIINQPEPWSIFRTATVVREAAGFRQVEQYTGGGSFATAGHMPFSSRGQYFNTTWYQCTYEAHRASNRLQFLPTITAHYQEDNIFQDALTLAGTNSSYYRLSSVAGQQYRYEATNSPIQITGAGLAALYRSNNSQPLDSQQHLYLGFDPREGDITLQIHQAGLQSLALANATVHLTLQVGTKGYPPSIIFPQPDGGLLSLQDHSQQINSHYLIGETAQPFRIRDNACVTRVAFMTDYQLYSDGPEIIRLQKPGETTFQTVWLKPPKQYLQLRLAQQRITGVLILAAEQLDVLSAQGEDASQSKIHLTPQVSRWTISIAGNLQITQNDSQLVVRGSANPEVLYSKTPSTPYQLTLADLEPLADSLRQPNPREFHFDTSAVRYAWTPGKATLQIIGPYQGQPAQLLLENSQATLSQGGQPLALFHYTPDITLDRRLQLQQVIPTPQGYRLLFQSTSGVQRFHQVAQDTFSSQGIHYQIRDNRLMALGADRQVIDGQQLIHYRPSRGVDIYINQTFNASELSRDSQSLQINALTLRHLPKQTQIYFKQQSFPWQALQETTHRHRHHHRNRRQLPDISSAAQRPTAWITQLWQGLRGILADTPPRLSQATYVPAPDSPEYTSGHLQGGLQLLDLVIRQWSGKKYSPPALMIDFDTDAKRRTTAAELAYAAQGPAIARLKQSLATALYEPSATTAQEPWLAYPQPTIDSLKLPQQLT